MGFWSFWASGVALAAVPIAHWFLMRRALAVSGRYTALIDTLRFGGDEAPEASADQAALIEALRAQTAETFGLDALDGALPEPEQQELDSKPPLTAGAHLLFFVGLALGGALSILLTTGAWRASGKLQGAGFDQLAQALGVPGPVLLLIGGFFIGVGTRMAGGCTSGHGLCGVSQLQPGSLLATAAFFGAGVGVSLGLSALL